MGKEYLISTTWQLLGLHSRYALDGEKNPGYRPRVIQSTADHSTELSRFTHSNVIIIIIIIGNSLSLSLSD
jgi:hypothetical protein